MIPPVSLPNRKLANLPVVLLARLENARLPQNGQARWILLEFFTWALGEQIRHAAGRVCDVSTGSSAKPYPSPIAARAPDSGRLATPDSPQQKSSFRPTSSSVFSWWKMIRGRPNESRHCFTISLARLRARLDRRSRAGYRDHAQQRARSLSCCRWARRTGSAAEIVRSERRSGRVIVLAARHPIPIPTLRAIAAGAADYIPLGRSDPRAIRAQHSPCANPSSEHCTRARRDRGAHHRKTRLNLLRDANHRFVENACSRFPLAADRHQGVRRDHRRGPRGRRQRGAGRVPADHPDPRRSSLRAWSTASSMRAGWNPI